MKPHTCSFIAALLIGSIYLAGCLPSPSSTPTPNILETATPEPSLAPSPTLSPTPTRTARPTAIATYEPLPTLSPAEAIKKVQELLETNGGCMYPCWWGITPGVTTWNDVLDALQPIAWRMSSLKNHPVYKDRVTREFYFAIDDRPTLMNSLMAIVVLKRETMEIEWIVSSHPYHLDKILLDYGTPKEIWLYATGIPLTGPVEYTIKLFYPDKGIMTFISSYAEMVHRNGEDYARVCNDLLIDETGGVLVWSSDKRMDFKKFFSEYEETDKHLPIEIVIDMTPIEFTQFILESDSRNCLELPMSKWEK